MQKALTAGFLALAVFFGSFFVIERYLDSQTYTTPREYAHLITSGSGSGSVIVVAPGYALTAAHVVASIDNYTINGLSVIYKWMDPKLDIAVLFVPGLECPCAPVGTNPFPDEKVVSIGYPLGLYQYATEGRMQGHDVEQPRSWLSTPIIFGNSGGGVFAFQMFQWKLVGITVDIRGISVGYGGAYFVAHMSRMVPISQIQDFIKRIHDGDVERE